MGKNSFIAIVALLIAVAGAIVAFAAYFKRRKCALCEDFDDELMDEDAEDLDYSATQVESDDDALEEQTPDAEAASSDDKASDTDKKDPDEEE